MRHVPVLKQETLDALALREGMKVIDCTLGDAGHSEGILEKISKSGKLLGIDADPEAMVRAKEFLKRFERQVVLVRDNFSHLEKIAKENNFVGIDAILMDFGWSSPQFEERNRGFSFQKNEPLDMRYSGEAEPSKKTAREILQDASFEELEKIFRLYGEESLSSKIAEKIVEERKKKQIETSFDFSEIMLSVYRKKLKSEKEIPWIGGLHPATKSFQALRIAVNEELSVIEEVLPVALSLLKSGGRLAVISFHSLEDRIVKHFFKSEEAKKNIQILTKRPIECGDEEYKNNPPSRSAKLRVVQKL